METRKYIDCREQASENNCSLKISGTEEEVLSAAVDHAVKVHGHSNTADFREMLRTSLKDEDDFSTRPPAGDQGREFEKMRAMHRN